MGSQTPHTGYTGSYQLLYRAWFFTLTVSTSQYVDIQPNDGFGTILPLETLQLDVIFQPIKAKEYRFELICKSEINR